MWIQLRSSPDNVAEADFAANRNRSIVGPSSCRSQAERALRHSKQGMTLSARLEARQELYCRIAGDELLRLGIV